MSTIDEYNSKKKIARLEHFQNKAQKLVDSLSSSELHSIFYLASKEILRGAIRPGTDFEKKFNEILEAYREGQN